MKLLVLGGAGYIGSHTATELLNDGHEVVIVDSLVTGYEKAVPEKAVFYKGDIRDEQFLDDLFKKEKIDALLLRYSWIFFLLSSALFVLFVILSNISPIFHVVYSLFFACTIIFLSYILCDTPVINNSFFALCGKYSLEIYVTHGFFLKLIKLDSISNILIYVVAVIVATMVASIILKKIYTLIVSFFSTSRL